MSVINLSNTFTRPNDTTAYASGDLVANSTTAGSVTPLSFDISNLGKSLRILRLRVNKSGTSTTNATFRVHLFTASPTVANGDNAAISANNSANWLGYIDCVVAQTFTDGAAGVVSGITASTFGNMPCVFSAGGSLYALLEARAAYTPTANETFTLTIEADGGN